MEHIHGRINQAALKNIQILGNSDIVVAASVVCLVG
jgi:hypothetical protein